MCSNMRVLRKFRVNLPGGSTQPNDLYLGGSKGHGKAVGSGDIIGMEAIASTSTTCNERVVAKKLMMPVYMSQEHDLKKTIMSL